MDQQSDLLRSIYENWLHLKDSYLNTPPVGIAIVLIVFFTALYYSFKDSSHTVTPRNRFDQALSTFSSKQRLIQSFKEQKFNESQESQSPQAKQIKSSIPKSKQKSVIQQKVKEKYLKSNKRSLLYETLDEQRAEEDRKNRQAEKAKRQQEQQRLREKMVKQQKQKELKEKQLRQKEKNKVKFEEDKSGKVENEVQLQSEKTVRSGQRKTTIQLVVDQNQKKLQEELPKGPQTFSLFGNPSGTQIGSLFNPAPTAPAINDQATRQSVPSTGTLGVTNQLINNQLNSIRMANIESNPSTAPKIEVGISQPSLFQNISKSPTFPSKEPAIISPAQNNQPSSSSNTSNVIAPPPISQPVRPSPAVAPARQQIALSSQQYLQQLMKYADSQSATVQIPTIMANLGGAKSSLNDLLTFAQSFIDTITKTDDNQLTAFSVKIYQGIVRQISTSNLKDGIYRIPPKSKTDQVQKNSINCYILYINLYRLMGFEKVWVIVFGKLLRLLQFIYKRKADLKKYTQLQLLVNKHVEKRGQLQGKYLSRIDYLTYMLFGLTAFDPIMIFRQIEEKEPNVRESRQKVESFGREWNYKEFWLLTDLFLKNKHDSYFKPIVYMNILSVLYPRIYLNKQNPERFKAENEVYKLILEQGKKYFSRFKTIPQLKALKESDEGNGFEYDGDNFIQDIKVLESRLTAEKVKEFNVRLGDNYANARDFQSKSNVFYYFCKEN